MVREVNETECSILHACGKKGQSAQLHRTKRGGGGDATGLTRAGDGDCH